MVLDQDHVAIVQHQPMAVEPCGDNGVVFFPRSGAMLVFVQVSSMNTRREGSIRP